MEDGMDDPIRQAERQAQRYWYVDGLSEIAAGGVILVIALYYAVLGWVAPLGVSGWLMTVGQLMVLILSTVLARIVVLALKERITYPRTGYMVLRRGSQPKRILLSLLAATLAIIIALVATLANSDLVRHFLLPVFPCLFVAYIGYTNGLRRFYPMALYTLVISIGNTYLGLGSLFDSALFFLAFGLGWLVTGAWGLHRYLATTHPAESAGDE
jgi:hypothetical protein